MSEFESVRARGALLGEYVIIIFAEFIRRDARNFSPMSNAKLLGNARGKGTLSPFPWSSAGPNV